MWKNKMQSRMGNLKELINHADSLGKKQGLELAIKYFDYYKIIAFCFMFLFLLIFAFKLKWEYAFIMAALIHLHLFLNHALWQIRTSQNFLEDKLK